MEKTSILLTKWKKHRGRWGWFIHPKRATIHTALFFMCSFMLCLFSSNNNKSPKQSKEMEVQILCPHPFIVGTFPELLLAGDGSGKKARVWETIVNNTGICDTPKGDSLYKARLRRCRKAKHVLFLMSSLLCHRARGRSASTDQSGGMQKVKSFLLIERSK